MRDETRAQDPGSGDSGGGKKLDTTVPQHRPWARRPDAHEVEIRYRRSVYYWRRRPACDRHGRRAEHECAT
jgi:hypothetical protein